MEETKTQCKDPGCPDCEARAREDAHNEETGLLFLIALMPLMTLTLFGNIGLI